MSRPIVGIGELLWDVFPDGHMVAGGAPFNFVFHCRQLGHDAVIISRVGDDDLGRRLRAEVRRLGLTEEFIQTDPVRPTGTVRVSINPAGQPSYEITEPVAWDAIACDRHLEALASRAKCVCHGSLVLRSETSRLAVRQFVAIARQSQAIRVFDVNLREPYVDPDVLRSELDSGGWVKLNGEELQRLASLSGMQEDEWIQSRLRNRHRHDVWVITKGADGARIATTEAEWVIPAVPAQVADTVGAGDAFTAAMVCLHLEGRPLLDCARFASHYAARVCEHRGATPRLDRITIEREARW